MRWDDPAPGERDAGERSWQIVRAAYAERLPAPAEHRRRRRRLLVAAVAAAALAAALSAPGLAVWDSVRDAVRGNENTRSALTSLPVSQSRLLVNSAQGAWVIQSDGSKRLLDGYRDAAWSPHGLYLAAVRGDELRALEPDGDMHWSVGRTSLATPRWSRAGGGDERVAYFSGSALRVIGGDGRGDRALARADSRVVPTWRPRTHVLAYVAGDGRVVVRNADSGAVQWRASVAQRPRGLEWSSDGRYLLVRGRSTLTIFGSSGRPRLSPLGPGAAPVADAAFQPRTHSVAFLQRTNSRSVVSYYARPAPDDTRARHVLSVGGVVDAIEWSPDGRWLLLSWRTADEWLFIKSIALRKVIPVAGIERAFGPAAIPAGWCCP